MATFERSSPGTLAIKTDQPECFRCDNHPAELLKRLQARRYLCDVVLIAGASGKRISAHRVILMASSDYFSDLLKEPKGDSKVVEITLNDVDGDALEKLVNFCYTGRLELTMDTINTIFITAKYLKLKETTEGCSEFFLRHLQPSNCLSVAFFAEELNLEALQHNVRKFICKHFQEVSKHPEFLLLNAKQLREFIASDGLDVPSEEFVFRVLMNWIEYEPENRRNHFTELLAQVRLPLLSSAFLMEKVEPLCNTVESLKLVMETLNSRLLLTSNFTQPRNSSSKSVVNQLWAISSNNKNVEIAGYNLRTKQWNTWNTPIKSRSGAAVTMMGEYLIVVGGSLYKSPINTVTKLNTHTMVSTEMAPLGTIRTKHAVAVLNGAIYAIGGYNGRRILNSVDRGPNFKWDPMKQTWDFIPVMEHSRQAPAAAVINDRLYVSGGVCGINILTSVECYHPVENTWRPTAPMKKKRHSHCLVAHKGYLFAIGGINIVRYENGNPIYDVNIPPERYDPRTDTWTTISCSPNVYGFTKCASLGSELYIYNKYKLYTISFEDSLKLEVLSTHSDTSIGSSCTELIAIA